MSTNVDTGSVSAKREYEEEIDILVKLFNEDDGLHVGLSHRRSNGAGGGNIDNKNISIFLEGSRLPFGALVKDIFEKLTGENDQDQSKIGEVTLVSVRSMVLSLGARESFGITKPDADPLEDDTLGSLWRWKVRDVKLLPKGSRVEVLDRRRWHNKIKDRIAALFATIQALDAANETSENGQVGYLKAKEALAKVEDESAIRAARMIWQNSTAVQKDPLTEQPNNLTQEPGSKRRKYDPEERERLRQEKLLKRHLAESEKEQKRKDREEADRRKHQQRLHREEADRKKQQQRQLDEAEKEQKRKEKGEGERRKQEKKQQDEAEKEQKREAERKKKLALKKQASFMDRFLVKKDQASCGQSQQAEAQTVSPAQESQNHESASSQSVQAAETAAVVARMDVELKSSNFPELTELWRMHVNHWLSLRNQCASGKTQRWGIRRKPKVCVYRELRLQGTGGYLRTSPLDESPGKKGTEDSSPVGHLKRPRDESECSEDIDWKDNVIDLCPDSPLEESKKLSSGRFHHLRKKARKLLQFDKSHRPPYYGTFSRKSDYIRPRHPLKQDPALDYDVDSDEEWEEEDPGESLSDVEKEEEDEKVEVEDIEDDEDGADEFVVPDGYLSENEGVAMEDSGREVVAEGSSSQSPQTPVPHNVVSPDRLRKVLDTATSHALRANHPFVVSNLGQVVGLDEQFPSNRTETLCLEALRMRVLVPNLLIGAAC